MQRVSYDGQSMSGLYMDFCKSWLQGLLAAVIVTSVMVAPCTAQISGIVAMWPLDEGEGEIVFSTVGQGLEGTLFGGTWIEGVKGTALALSGANEYLAFLDSNVPSSIPFTISLWIRLPADAGDFAGIMWRSVGNYVGWWLGHHHSGHARLVVGHGDSYSSVSGGPDLRNGKWHQLIAVIAPGELRLYVDGELAGHAGFDKDVVFADRPLMVGGELKWMGLVGAFVGDVDEIVVFERALTEEEVKTLFTVGVKGD